MDIFFLLKSIPNSNECITARRRGERVDVTKFGTREGRILRESMSPQCTVRLRHECFINQNFTSNKNPLNGSPNLQADCFRTVIGNVLSGTRPRKLC